MSEKILLTITMLVSDREDTIEKCMKSLVHLRETVPSELIVVDTAGNQACMDIVKQYTENIVKFEWINDFAAARNAGAKKARGEWLMFLDDDEWFESTEELEQFFLSNERQKYNTVSYIVRNYHNLQGTSWSDFRATRIAKREKNTAFQGKIHEQISPMRPPTRYVKDYVHHYGYVFKSSKAKNEHSWRNIGLLLQMHQENPNDPHTTGQLIQEYFAVREYFSAIELCKSLRNAPNCWKDLNWCRYAIYAVMIELRTYIIQQRTQEAYDLGCQLLAVKDIALMAKGIIYNQMVTACFQLKKYDEVIEYIEKFRSFLPEWEQFPEKEYQDAFSSCSSYVDKKELKRFYFLQLHIHVLQQEWTKAGEDILAIDWNSGERKLLQETPGDIVKTLKEIPFDNSYVAALKHLQASVRIRLDTYSEVDKLTAGQKSLLMSYFALLPPIDSKMCQYHLIYAGEKNDFGLAIPALETMAGSNFPFFLESKPYWDSLLKLNININSYMTALSVYEWMEMAKRLWSQAALETCEAAYLCLIRGLEKSELRFIFLSALMMEKQLLEAKAKQEGAAEDQTEKNVEETAATEEAEEGPEAYVTDDGTDRGKEDSQPEENKPSVVSLPKLLWTTYTPDEIWNKLFQLSQYWVSCAASLYREDVFMGNLIQAIPPAYRFGWYIMQANAVKDEDHNLFLHKVADAAKAYPAMKELCKKIIKDE